MRFLIALALAVTIAQQPPPAQKPPPATPPPATAGQVPAKPGTLPAAPVQGPYEFTSDLGAFLIVVKADKVALFDSAMTKLKQALATSTASTARKHQASGWRVLKSTETATPGSAAVAAVPATATTPAIAAVPAGSATMTYILLIDPVSKKASYDPIEIMREISPDDVQAVYDQLSEAIVSATRIGLTELLKMGG